MCRGNLFLSHTNTHSVVVSAKSAISKEKKNVRLCALCVRCGNNVMIVGEKSFVWGISFFFFLMNNRLSGDLASFMVCWSLFRREGREIKIIKIFPPQKTGKSITEKKNTSAQISSCRFLSVFTRPDPALFLLLPPHSRAHTNNKQQKKHNPLEKRLCEKRTQGRRRRCFFRRLVLLLLLLLLLLRWLVPKFIVFATSEEDEEV